MATAGVRFGVLPTKMRWLLNSDETPKAANSFRSTFSDLNSFRLRMLAMASSVEEELQSGHSQVVSLARFLRCHYRNERFLMERNYCNRCSALFHFDTRRLRRPVEVEAPRVSVIPISAALLS